MRSQLFPFLDGEEESPSIWVNSFGEIGLKRFMEKFFKLESDPEISLIPIFISSYGGSVHGLLGMRDIIKSSSKPVATIALGKAMSAGACLLASGDKGLRFVAPSASIMVHEVSSGGWGKSNDLQIAAAETERLNAVLLKNLSEDTGKTVQQIHEKFASLKNADWFLSASEAVKFGLADNIAVPRLAQQPIVSGLVTNEDAAKARKAGIKPRTIKTK